MVSTPTWHHDFYRKELATGLAVTGSAQALITGAADYSTLAYLAAAAKDVNEHAQIHVLDQCATPLFACRWYAKRNGLDIIPYEDDIFSFDRLPSASLDLICTDAFLTRFARPDAQRILGIWHRLLRTSGRVVTTVRVHQRSLVARDTEAAIADFRERAVQRARRWEPFLHRTAAEIGELAEVYARKMQGSPLGDVAEIRMMIQNAGFQIDRWELGEVPGELYPTIYVRLTCIKT